MAQLAPDVMGLWLRLPAIEPFTWQAGQYVDVMLPGERRRSFSLANPPHDAALLELHVRRVPGGAFSERVFSDMKPGALLRIEGPLGQFVYRPGERPLLLIGGGTGYAPLKAMIRHVLEGGTTRDVRSSGARARRRTSTRTRGCASSHRSSPRFHYTSVLTEFVHEAVLRNVASLDCLRHLCRRASRHDRRGARRRCRARAPTRSGSISIRSTTRRPERASGRARR